MSERKTWLKPPAPDVSENDPREERLRILYRAAYQPASPSEALRRRVARTIAEPNAPIAPQGFGWVRQIGRAPATRMAAASLFLVAVSLVLAWMGHERSVGRPAPTTAKVPPGEQ